MTRTTLYEWDAELTATEGHPDCEAGDVLDHNHRDTLAEAMAVKATDPSTTTCLVLVRDVGNEADGLMDRSWAYLQPDGKLPEAFSYSNGALGAVVPKRFHAEVARTTR